MSKVLVIVVGLVLVFIGIFIGTYEWGFETKEQYCYICGLTQVKSYKKTIFNLSGSETSFFSDSESFLSAYLDDVAHCNHEWVVYKRFPISFDKSENQKMEHVISSLYWYNWCDINGYIDFQFTLANMFQDNPMKTKDFIQKVFNPDNLIAPSDAIRIFYLEISWVEKWQKWDDFLENYQVVKNDGSAQSILYTTDTTSLIVWDVKGGSYSKYPINWTE